MVGKIIAIIGIILILGAIIFIGKALYHAFFLARSLDSKKEKWAQIVPWAIIASPWFFSKEAHPHLKAFQVSLIMGLLCMLLFAGLTSI